MQATRLNLGEKPTVEIGDCAGDVELRGSTSGEIVIENDGGAFEVNTAGEHASMADIAGHCSIRVPEGGQLKIGSVGGQLRVKGVAGNVEIGTVGGDCAARRVGSLRIGNVGGEFHVKLASGEVSVGTIGGDVVLRDCDGPVRIEMAGGDLSARGVTAGLDVGRASGDIDFRSEIAAGAAYRLTAGGDVIVRVPAESSVRFVLTGAGGVRLDQGLQGTKEGEETIIVTLGDGASTMEVKADGDIRVRLDDNCCDTEDEFDVSFTEDMDNYMVDVSAQLDSHFRKLETKLEGLPDKVRRRVERKLDSALRHVHIAEQQARHAAEHAAHGKHHFGFVIPTQGGASSQQPVSEEERMTILKMLEEGKINVEEAHMLLSALEGER